MSPLSILSGVGDARPGEMLVSKRNRNFKAEYARRIANAAATGKSRSQARGHPKPSEAAISSKRPQRPIEDDRLQLAFKVLRQEKSLTAAAKAAKIAPERLRHFATEREVIERQGRRWIVRHQLPRRMLLFSDGKAVQVVVGDFSSASKVGRFMSAVSDFLRTNNPAGLREFEGVGVTDVFGKSHPFETRPNALYRLASAHDQSFEHIYRIVV
jgi:hypothetical protein